MSLLLNIDTALDTASICLVKNQQVLQLSFSENQKDHASWLHYAVNDQMQKTGHSLQDLDAIAVSIGPGSYTGLRVGLAAAKGYCYALNIPLITVNTLKLIALAAKGEATGLICPLIDARRMEVFIAVYTNDMEEKIPAHSMIINENSFSNLLSTEKILFCGNAVKKLQPLLINSNASFSTIIADASHLAQLSFPLFNDGQFANLAYTEPFYLKEFYTPADKR